MPSESSELPSTAQLLMSAKDARLRCDPRTGLNKYGCSSFPDPAVLAYGSSTASAVSERGFSAADGLRNRLAHSFGVSPAEHYVNELMRLRVELFELLGLQDLRGLEAIFAASGTHAHLLAAHLAAAAGPLSPLVMAVEPEETGSFVQAALSGRHIWDLSAQTTPGGEICCANVIETVAVRCRDDAGEPRPAGTAGAEVEALATQAVSARRSVLLNLIDVSKTGLISPSLACALSLRERFPEAVDVLVDACQFRLTRATLRAYLERGFWVALTGSKFFTGPPFSGVLLLPEGAASRLRQRRLPAGLGLYSAQGEWPQGWASSNGFPEIANYGLLLRWEAALAEMRAFYALPEAQVMRFFETFALAVHGYAAENPAFALLPVAELDRGPCVTGKGWDSVQTIFPIVLHRFGRPGRSEPLGHEETMKIYGLLLKDLASDHSGDPSLGQAQPVVGARCQLGRPVRCGSRGGPEMSALRLCASARLAVAALVPQASGVRRAIDGALTALDKAVWLAARTH